ncbi:hypothetical protein RRG08_054251 [Elysia crispata]|uniref:Secreted protein n=1 Tax=Elysia crispata TaxID=231223 RepID=A0AAE0YCX1_9GAST|nr:hypothetical protein RRG08_054251 [Elysia crispata]
MRISYFVLFTMCGLMLRSSEQTIVFFIDHGRVRGELTLTCCKYGLCDNSYKLIKGSNFGERRSQKSNNVPCSPVKKNSCVLTLQGKTDRSTVKAARRTWQHGVTILSKYHRMEWTYKADNCLNSSRLSRTIFYELRSLRVRRWDRNILNIDS